MLGKNQQNRSSNSDHLPSFKDQVDQIESASGPIPLATAHPVTSERTITAEREQTHNEALAERIANLERQLLERNNEASANARQLEPVQQRPDPDSVQVDFPNDDDDVNSVALQEEKKGKLEFLTIETKTCRFLLALVFVMIVALAGTMAGLCGKGVFCNNGTSDKSSLSTNEDSINRLSTPMPQPTTSPTPFPTFPSIIPTRAQTILDAANNVELSTQTLRYPLPSFDASPEEIALAWLIDDDPAQTPASVELSHAQTQRWVLATMWFQSTIPWSPNFDWLTPELECTWLYVQCSSNVITELNVNNDNVHGTIPETIGLLTGLSQLGLADNHLTGTLPTSLGLLTNMKRFLGRNNAGLTGTIPSELYEKWPALIFGTFDNTEIKGTVPFCPARSANVAIWADCDEVECPCCRRCFCNNGTDFGGLQCGSM